MLKEVREVRRGQVMEGLVVKEQEFELYALLNMEPVELLQNGSDVLEQGQKSSGYIVVSVVELSEDQTGYCSSLEVIKA